MVQVHWRQFLRLLVFGSRDWDSLDIIVETLDAVHAAHKITRIINGGATGADIMSSAASGTLRLPPPTVFKADWATHKKAAGPIRNQQMLDEGEPDAALGFILDPAHSPGSWDMYERASKVLPHMVLTKDTWLQWVQDGCVFHAPVEEEVEHVC